MLGASFGTVHAACTTATPCATTPHDLGTLGGINSNAYGVADGGGAVVGDALLAGNGSAHAFLWQSGAMTDLGTLAGGLNSFARDVSDDGSVVVGTSGAAGGTIRAFRWQGGVMTDLGTVGGTLSDGLGVSGDGLVVVGLSYLAGDVDHHAFRWQGGNMTDLGTLGGDNSVANSTSGDGSVVVGFSETVAGQLSGHAFRWQGGVMTDLGTLAGGTDSYAFAVSRDGAVIVGSSSHAGSGTHAFRWQSGAMADLGTLGGTNSYAYGVSGDGAVIVGTSQPSGNGSFAAFRWTQVTGIQDLNSLLTGAGVNMGGITLVDARGISNDGQFIVGQGNFSGSSRGYLVRYFDGEAGPVAGATNYGAIQSSLDDVAGAHRGVMAQQHGLLSALLGNDKPMTNESYAGAFASAGSASVGGFTQLSTDGGLSLLGGVSYGTEDYESAEINDGISGALAVRYLLSSGAALAPFVEGGGWITRNASLEFDRTYDNGAGTASGHGGTEGDISYLYGRAGVLYKLSNASQVVAAVEVGRERMSTQAYSEQLSAANPFEAHFTSGSDLMDITKLRLQWSHSLTSKLDMTLWAAGVRSFNTETDVAASVAAFGTVAAASLDESTWVEYGARLGYRVSEGVTIDAFTNGVSGNDDIGTRVHGGADVRVRF